MKKERTWNGPSKCLGYKTEIHRFSYMFFMKNLATQENLWYYKTMTRSAAPMLGKMTHEAEAHSQFQKSQLWKSMRYVVVQDLDTGGRDCALIRSDKQWRSVAIPCPWPRKSTEVPDAAHKKLRVSSVEKSLIMQKIVCTPEGAGRRRSSSSL